MSNDSIQTMFARPGMYIAPYDQKLDAASIYLNFLIAAYSSPSLGYPLYIDITTSGSIFTISAKQQNLEIGEALWHDLSSMFDIASHEHHLPDEHLWLEFIRPIIWFTEYSLVQITSSQGKYQQVFVYGKPVTEIRQPKTTEQQLALGYSISFTMRSDLFPSPFLDISNLKQAVSTWQTSYLPRNFLDKTPPQLVLNWCEQDTYHHSLRISTDPK